MSIAESLYFVYDGIRSDEMGLINVNLETGMLEEHFLPEQTIKEITIRGRDTPYFVETSREPFTLSLNFAFMDTFDEDKIRNVVNWIANQPYYKPLYFSDNIDKWYYTLYTGESKLLHNALKQGYITIQMRNISPYVYSPVIQPGIYDFSLNSDNGTEVVFENLGTLPCYPKMKIQKIGSGNVQIINYSDRGSSFTINNLADNEIVEIDCENEDIVSDIPLTYHFDDVVGDYPRLVTGANYIKVIGKCKIQWTYQYISQG